MTKLLWSGVLAAGLFAAAGPAGAHGWPTPYAGGYCGPRHCGPAWGCPPRVGYYPRPYCGPVVAPAPVYVAPAYPAYYPPRVGGYIGYSNGPAYGPYGYRPGISVGFSFAR